jgi:hypothetical protein
MGKTVFEVIQKRLDELIDDYGKNKFNNEHDRLVRIGELQLLMIRINEELTKKIYLASLKSIASHTKKLSENET